jgi:hypothetical protein
MYEINKSLESVHHLFWNNWLFGKVDLFPSSVGWVARELRFILSTDPNWINGSDSIPDSARFSFLSGIQTDSGAQPASYQKSIH